MRLFKGYETLVASPEFTALSEGGRFYFIHASGRRVRTDRLGSLIWQALPGTPAEIIEGIKAAGFRADRSVEWKESACVPHTGASEKQKGPSRRGGTSIENERDRGLPEFLEAYVYTLYRAGILASSIAGDEGRSRAGATGTHAGGVEAESRFVPEGGERSLVSVIVVTHNGSSHLGDCFGSLFGQTYRNLEIIAVDNESTDGTPRLIRDKFPGVRVLALAKNLHFAAAVNVGIRAAKGHYFFVLNQDVEVEPECVARLVARMRSEDQAGAAVPMMKFFDLRGFINGLGNHIRPRSWGSDNFIGLVDVGQFAGLREVPSGCFGAVFLTREAVDDVGLLDERYTAFYEDMDWSLRCWMRGWRIVPEPEAVVYHKFGASYLPADKLRLAVRNRMRLVLKLFRGRKLLAYARRYLFEDMKNSFSLLFAGRREMAVAYPSAYFSLWLQMPGIYALRRRMHKEAISGIREKDILAKNPEFFSGLDEEGAPVVDSGIVENYYRRAISRPARSLL
jgi:GT2 family glycosyltransferase